MGSNRLLHDCSWSAAVSIVQCFEDFLRPEEGPEALQEVYQRVKAAIECYEQMAQREAARLKPSRN